ncbi:hypothetical protein SANTM175S_02037 [Streptomyces antimycoticus]
MLASMQRDLGLSADEARMRISNEYLGRGVNRACARAWAAATAAHG